MTMSAAAKKALLGSALAAAGYAAAPPKLLWQYGIHKAWPMEWFEVEASDGTILSSDDCEGRPVLLVTWAAWCPYMPENLKVVERVKMRYRSTDACIVPASTDEHKEKAWEFARSQSLVEPYYWGYSGLADMYWGHNTPHAFVFDRDGSLVLSRDTLAGDYDAVMEAMDAVVHDGAPDDSPSPTAPGHGLKPMPELVENDEASGRARELYDSGNLDGLEALAKEWRGQRARTALGVWKEWLLYNAIVLESDAENATDADYEARLRSFESWTSTRPASVVARTALARQWYQYAWHARGHGWSSSVDDAAAGLFHDRLEKAGAVFEQAEAMPDKTPVVYHSMLALARAQGWPEPKMDGLFRKALAFEPDYLPYYFTRAVGFEPRWGGSEQALRNFVETSADARGAGGDELYARLVWELNDHFEQDGVNPFKRGYSWPRVLAGYRALIARDPGPAWRLECAKLAALAGDRAVAQEMFASEGVRWEPWAWRDRGQFIKARRWARRPALWRRLASWIGLGGFA